MLHGRLACARREAGDPGGRDDDRRRRYEALDAVAERLGYRGGHLRGECFTAADLDVRRALPLPWPSRRSTAVALP